MFRSLKEYPRIMWIICIGVAISAIGESFLWPLTTTYIHVTLGKSLTVATLVLLLQYTGCLIGNLVGGMLFDRWDGRKTIALAITGAIVLLLLMSLQLGFVQYVIFLVLLGICNGMIWPLQRALGATLWPEGGRRAMNMIYVANNLGVAIGAASGGLLASHSFSMAFLGNALTYAVFLAIFLINIKPTHLIRQKEAQKQRAAAPAVRVSMRVWASLGAISVGLTVLVITYVQWQTTLSTYVQALGVTMPLYSFLWTLNGLVIVLGQPILSWALHKSLLSIQGQIVIGALIFILSWMIISSTTAYLGFAVAMCIITVGEMLVWPGVPAIAAELAPSGREGIFQGIAFSGQSVGRMIGPLLGGFLYEQHSSDSMILTMTAISVVALGCFLLYGRLGRRSTPHDVSAAPPSL